MNRPNIEDYKLAGGGYSQKYITDLEKYCNELEKANETMAFYQDRTKEDKALFVKNLGWLLSQTRNQVEKCEYMAESELVKITFIGGYEKYVNINLDSYLAIVLDVAKHCR